VPLQFDREWRWQSDDTPAGIGLGRSDQETSVGKVVALFHDGDGVVKEIDSRPGEGEQLTPPQPGEGGPRPRR